MYIVCHVSGSDFPTLENVKLRLYSMRLCPFAQRARLVLEHKNIEYVTVTYMYMYILVMCSAELNKVLSKRVSYLLIEIERSVGYLNKGALCGSSWLLNYLIFAYYKRKFGDL